jgi:hypothetical protein
MSRLTHSTTTSSLYSMAGAFGEFQVVATPKAVVLDVQAQAWDVDGHRRHESALTHLTVSEASRLRDLLNEAIIVAETADARQPGLWSDATTRAIAGQLRRPRRLA